MLDLSEIADSIDRIDNAIRLMRGSGLSARAIEVLLQDATGGMPLKEIRKVIQGMSELKKLYTVPKK